MLTTTIKFDNEKELALTGTELTVSRNEPLITNPFPSGSITTNSGFIEIVSGAPLVSSSGEVITIPFDETISLRKIYIGQNPDNYAVTYSVGAVTSTGIKNLFYTSGSIHSGDITIKLPLINDVSGIIITVNEISQPYNSYTITSISGEAAISKIEFGIPVVDISSISASSNVEPVSNMIDDNDDTFWQSNNTHPHIIDVVFNEQKFVSTITYITEDNLAYPTELSVHGSIDGITYNLIKTFTGLTDGFNTLENIDYLSSHLRIVISNSSSNKVRIKEMLFYETVENSVDVNEITLKKKTATLHSIEATPTTSDVHLPSNMIDKNYSTMWESQAIFTGPGNTGMAGVIMTFNEPAVLNAVRIRCGSTGKPVDFSIVGYNGMTSTEIVTFNGLTLNDSEQYMFKFDNNNAYISYTVRITRSTDSTVSISEISFDGYSYEFSNNHVILPEIYADSIQSFSAVEGNIHPIASTITYSVNVDGKNYWFDGSNFVESNLTFLQSNRLDEINSNTNKLNSLIKEENSSVKLIAVLNTITGNSPVLKSVTYNYNNFSTREFTPSNMIRIRGYITGITTMKMPIKMEISLLNSTIKLDGQTVGFSAKVIYSDSNGYFDFMLPQTELASPKKARFSVVIGDINFRRERYTPAVTNISLSDWLNGNF